MLLLVLGTAPPSITSIWWSPLLGELSDSLLPVSLLEDMLLEGMLLEDMLLEGMFTADE
jgi:hypothetical protein